MNINIKATKTTLTSAIKSFIYEKVQALEKFIKPEDKVYIEIEVDKKHHKGLIYRAEINIKPHGYYAESFAEDFYAAMDLLVPKIKEQLVKGKEKKLSKERRSMRRKRN